MTHAQALARLIEKLETRAAQWPDADDSLTLEWSRGVAAATKWALEDARMLASIAHEPVRDRMGRSTK